MYHSLTIGGKNTWDEWKLIPSSRPDFAIPDAVTNYVDITGRYMPLDLSEVLTGHIMYSPRQGNWDFYVFNDYPEYDWNKIRDSVASHMHGKIMDVIPEDDPKYFYRGRLLVSWTTGSEWSRIQIEYALNPFKHPIENPKDYENVNVNGQAKLSVFGFDEYVVPEFRVTSSEAGLNFSVDDRFGHLANGMNRIKDLSLGPGEHKFTFYGSGTVSVIYRGGIL